MTIQLPDAYAEKALRIARYKGAPRSTWIANLVQARIESIYPQYLEIWTQDAAEKGVPLDGYIAQLDNKGEEE
jgi:hypothetical protein